MQPLPLPENERRGAYDNAAVLLHLFSDSLGDIDQQIATSIHPHFK